MPKYFFNFSNRYPQYKILGILILSALVTMYLDKFYWKDKMINTKQILVKKRSGEELTQEELKHIIHGYVAGDIPDYQVAAFLMAVYFRGMTFNETYHLTKFMLESGEKVEFDFAKGIPVDKHSTGGVGDKVSLILAPLVAAAGIAVPMISGRGLGHSGGTLDKLDAIPGFRTNMSIAEFKKQVEKIGVALIGQTEKIVPADRKIYALRDTTATVPSIPLIVGSILSKKIAEGAGALVLDVKFGKGAFFNTQEESIKLAEALIAISDKFDLETTALLTSMDQPLGNTIGNWLETEEAIETLKGKGPADLVEITLALGAEMLVRGKKADNFNVGEQLLKDILYSGKALEKFMQIVELQGGDLKYIENPKLYEQCNYSQYFKSPINGYISGLNALKIGVLANEIGAGRTKITDKIDYSAGIILKKKIGDYVEKGEPLIEVYYSQKLSPDYILKNIENSIEFSETFVRPPALIQKYINKKGQYNWPIHS